MSGEEGKDLGTSWTTDEEAAAAAAAAAATLPPPDPTPHPAAGSVVDQIGQQAVAVVEDADDRRVLQVGIHPTLRARYRPLLDTERDELQAIARARFRRQAMIGQGHRRKGQAEPGSDDAPEVERYFNALLLAKACVEILHEDLQTGKLTPLQDVLETQTPVRYTRELAKLARLDETLGLKLDAASPDEIVTAMHTWGEERSTTPLDSRAQVLKIWMGKIDAAGLEEALGNR